MIQILYTGNVNGMLRGIRQPDTCLIVTPGEHHIIETAMRLVNAVFCRINLIVRIWVCFKRLGVYDLVRKLAADDKCVLLGKSSVSV